MNSKTLFFKSLIGLFLVLVIASGSFAAENGQVVDEFFPEGLVDAEQRYVDTANLHGKIFALYFSASWCRGCAAFSRILVPFRDRHHENFEVVMLGFDNSAEDMFAYMKNYSMLWPAVAWESPIRTALKEKFAVSEIPKLIVVAPNGQVITTDGYKQIEHMGDAALDNWLKVSGLPAK